ncbi:coatomer/calthrin adaptor appendage, C-terminal subdomain-containing protein [Artemisia annua]|uniref:Coatomer/calthrin adaptor appendage, C-terminal subdomain-containing protein n=1 Tax=Artemisia annua TaxID=35608 RepID=A0A2U1NLB2_ARTAN|nr:coatomer/calthrin adaptor appendage, C-terminal subdomain-containing protein [Artemisia annua]
MAQYVKKDDDRDEEAEYSPFAGIEKGAVLQEARVFNDPQLDPRRCSQVITKLLYLLNQGDTFTKNEATEVFFAVTKLFQSRDFGLRRMVYLIIKELSPSSDEVIIVTSSLMKDMNSKTDVYRANAIRVLCRITDGTLLTQIERYLKQAIVDKNPVVASAALVSGIHWLKSNPEIVKRWSNEVQEAVQSRSALVQFHALGLLHQIRQNDRLAVSKLVSSLTKGTVRSPLAQCLLIRYTSQVIRESSMNGQTGDRPFYDYLEGCLRHKAEMVIFEAARAITELSGVTSRELTPAITVLQLFLSSSKPVLRFAAVRTLNKVAMTHPMAVTSCNIDMESLISDQNRSIATLAITTLLKTGNEAGVDRLMKQITNFMSDIADEFKIVVVDAIRSLCLKFPLKFRTLMNFLSNILREEGGFEYKKAIVDSIVTIIRDIPDAKESGLLHLCEFIEDCEFTYLSTQILHFLGIEGPKTSDPSKFIRYIYNRVILENATVRASAVSTLAKFGAMVDSLKPRIFVLLRRCLYDNDDEVRDRATLYLNTIGGDGSVVETDKDVKEFLFGSLDLPLANLETSLKNYEPSEEPFSVKSVSREVKSQPFSEKKAAAKKPTGLGAPPAGPTSTVDTYEKLLSAIPEFSTFGQLFKSSAPVELTEAETEYAVNVVKHIFDEHVVFQYNCTNTIPEQLLEDVTIVVDASEAEEFEELATKPLKSLPYDTPGQTFVAFEKPAGVPAVGKFANVLRFNVKEDYGVEDEYQLEEFEVVPSDYMLKVGVSNFRNAWESLGPDFERVDEYGLGPRESLKEAVSAVIGLLGMQPCEGTEVVAANSRSHTCLLSGVYIGNVKVLVRLSFGVESSKEVAMKLSVRSEDEADDATAAVESEGDGRLKSQAPLAFFKLKTLLTWSCQADYGVEDEYQLEEFEVVPSDYMLKVGVSNFRNAWESLGPDFERVDEYGLGPRESLKEAVSAVIGLLGMQPCEGTEVVAANSRSHTCLLSGVYIGNVKVLVRLSFGVESSKEVAMKLSVRSEDEAGTEVVAVNSRSHTCLLSGVYIGNVKVLVRLSFGVEIFKEVAMKLSVRSEDEADTHHHYYPK